MNPSDLPPDALLEACSIDNVDRSRPPATALPSDDKSSRSSDQVRKDGLVIGELLAIVDDGSSPLVRYPGQPGTAALRARTLVDLYGSHIGSSIALMFEDGEPSRPLVIGVVRGALATDPNGRSRVEVEMDGGTTVITASEQLVLRCGKASITLTSAGKIVIDGSYLISRSSGTNRIKGGSIQLN